MNAELAAAPQLDFGPTFGSGNANSERNLMTAGPEPAFRLVKWWPGDRHTINDTQKLHVFGHWRKADRRAPRVGTGEVFD